MDPERSYFIPRALAVAVVLILVAFLSRVGWLVPHPKLETSQPSENQGANLLGAVANTATTTPGARVSEDDDAVLGDAASPVSIIEFNDFACPECNFFFEVVQPKLFAEFIRTGKAHLVLRDYPMYGDTSWRAAEAAECAGAQGSYWAYAQELFRAQSPGDESVFAAEHLKKIAGAVSLDMSQFAACLDTEQYRGEVEHDAEDAAAAGITQTPTFIINGKVFAGLVSWDEMKRHVEEALNTISDH